MQVGYTRKSDGCVSSGWYEGRLLESHLRELIFDDDVPDVWLRARPGGSGAAFVIKKQGKILEFVPAEEPEFLSMPDPPGTTRIEEIRKRLHGEA